MSGKSLSIAEVDWLVQFDQTKDKFKWFWVEYFTETYWNKFLMYREKEDINRMRGMMNFVWYMLKCNIKDKENPEGWNEFLELRKLADL